MNPPLSSSRTRVSPGFVCEAHDVEYPAETLDKFERAVDITLNKLPPSKTERTGPEFADQVNQSAINTSGAN